MSKKEKPSYIIKNIAPERLMIIDFMQTSLKHPNMNGLLELDVTKVRSYIDEYEEKTGIQLSLTGFIAYSMAKAINQDKRMNALKKGKKKLVIFDDVDIMVVIERKFGEKKAPIGHIIRKANEKSYEEIHQEIRAKQTETLGGDFQSKTQLRYKRMPWFLKKAMWRKYNRDPIFKKKLSGTCSITAVGMFGEGNGWGVVPTNLPVTVVLGGIGKKPAVVNDQIVIREFLSITLCFDHDIVDGAPATRFAMHLKELVESGDGLVNQVEK